VHVVRAMVGLGASLLTPGYLLPSAILQLSDSLSPDQFRCIGKVTAHFSTWKTAIKESPPVTKFLKRQSKIAKEPAEKVERQLQPFLAFLLAHAGNDDGKVKFARQMAVTLARVTLIARGHDVRSMQAAWHLDDAGIGWFQLKRKGRYKFHSEPVVRHTQEPKLCLLYWIETYVRRAQDKGWWNNPTATGLWRSLSKPYHDVKTKVLSEDTKVLLKLAGMTDVKPSHLRHLAATAAAVAKVPVITLMERGDWHSFQVFKRHYARPGLQQDWMALFHKTCSVNGLPVPQVDATTDAVPAPQLPSSGDSSSDSGSSSQSSDSDSSSSGQSEGGRAPASMLRFRGRGRGRC
jgi:hypothetical protein